MNLVCSRGNARTALVHLARSATAVDAIPGSCWDGGTFVLARSAPFCIASSYKYIVLFLGCSLEDPHVAQNKYRLLDAHLEHRQLLPLRLPLCQ